MNDVIITAKKNGQTYTWCKETCKSLGVERLIDLIKKEGLTNIKITKV